ncbi:ArnT family glycosyltransferase [Nocardia sp. CA-119907]|uniref:ArnT family glycosyltransferase n=1 Tax=Nocardia sp. CA-119907 TaxID=3239973 RepID=UPI003D999A9E
MDEAPTRRSRWESVALAALLVGTAAAYLCNLSANGWANAFYSAAAQAGSQSWAAFFFGSSDAAGFITVDKPPASLWPVDLSVRIFGLHSWSIQAPQVLLGVASVALLWAAVRRVFGAAAGLIAGLTLALTPVAALIFRYNNPDALLVFLMVAAAWALLRAIDDGRTQWLVLAGACIGFGFLAKQLQVLLVVPALAGTYLIAGPPRLATRIVQLLAVAAAMVVSAVWWLLAVELWPTSSRPWIGGSQHNSILELTLGYNGLGRLTGDEPGSSWGTMPAPSGPGSGPSGSVFGSGPGLTRMLDSAQGGQIGWLIPAALILLIAGLLLRGKAIRTDARRASLLVWGGWLLVTGLVFSYMAGIFHQYYTVALAPAIAALVGAGSAMLWRQRNRLTARLTLAASIAVTAITAWILLSRNPDFVPWLRWAVLAVGVLAASAMLIPVRGRLAAVVAAAAAMATLAGPTAYTIDTIATSHTNAIPVAGPNAGTPDFSELGFGPAGGMMTVSTPSDRLVALLEKDGDDFTWAAAAVTSNSAAGFQLATRLPIMAIGGFNGTDPAPTLAQFQKYVANRSIHYFIDHQDGPDRATSDSEADRITQWVRSTFAAKQVDGVTVYDLAAARQ